MVWHIFPQHACILSTCPRFLMLHCLLEKIQNCFQPQITCYFTKVPQLRSKKRSTLQRGPSECMKTVSKNSHPNQAFFLSRVDNIKVKRKVSFFPSTCLSSFYCGPISPLFFLLYMAWRLPLGVMKSSQNMGNLVTWKEVIQKGKCVVPENIHTPPPMEGISPKTPTSSGFSKISSQSGPLPPLRKFHFCHTPPGNIIIPCGKQK